MTRCAFVPPYLLERVAATHRDDAVSACCRSTLALDGELRTRRTARDTLPVPAPAPDAGPFAVHSAGNGTTLPGALVRAAGAPAVGDAAVDEAYAGVEAALALLREAFGRASYDGQSAPVVATVHYGSGYDNAFWDGRQLVFGDGDRKVFDRFTKPVDVLGHELAHAVTEHTAGLVYSGQSGALNESVSDVFASCLKQWLLGQTADEADWLIGEGIFMPAVRGRALRSMAEPGTAYDDPVLGRDPQVASMDAYVTTTQDNGGVHLNSGIPNRAFHLAATGIGGRSWEGAGQIWYAALTSGIGPQTDFATFADATVSAAAKVSTAARDVVLGAWETVGVARGAGPMVPDGAPAAGERVVVTRSGGFAGLRQSGEVLLGDDPRTAELRRLLPRIDLRAAGRDRVVPMPDRFVYEFEVLGLRVTVHEQDLTPELEQLAHLVLETPP
jgi:thermolysin metallopeptidase-like protein/emfourin